MIPKESAGDMLLDAWLTLSSTLWNSRIVSSLTYNETHVMGILLRKSSKETPMTATDLIRLTRMLKSQMNKTLTSLEERSYITRTRSPEDKRLIHVLLTKEGKDAYLVEHTRVEAIMSSLVDKIGEERAAALAAELNTVSAYLDDIVPAGK